VLFDDGGVRQSLHSYFDGEADRNETLGRPENGLAEDALYLWARGLAAPRLAPGESRRVPLLLSLQLARLEHRALDWTQATLTRDKSFSSVTVPAGTFEVDSYRASLADGRSWHFLVERSAPHRLVQWETAGGERAQLIASERLPYWQLNANRDTPRLEQIGLEPRPPRTP